MKKLFLAAIAATLVVPATTDFADARKSKKSYSSKRYRAKGARGFFSPRGETSGSCPCNGGDVCVGPRGGRYCITSGGNKRYGV